MTVEKAKLARAQTELAELKLQTARGEIVPAEDVLDHWTQIITNARQNLLAFADRVAQILETTADSAAARKAVLTREVETVLGILSSADGLPDTETGDDDGRREKSTDRKPAGKRRGRPPKNHKG